MSIYAIGDIHGCYSELCTLLNMINLKEDDTIVFLGDYIDRGPDTAKVIKKLIEIKSTFSSSYFLKGNHEEMFLTPYMKYIWLQNGGKKTIKSYYKEGYDGRFPREHITFMQKLSPYIIIDDYCFVHAGFVPEISIEENDEDDILWMREEFITSNYDWGKKIIFGHTVLKFPLINDNKIGIDTGCFKTGILTAVKLPEIDIIQTRRVE